MDAVERWEALGRRVDLLGRDIFVIDQGPRDAHPILILHGFPTCSFDWRAIIPRLAQRRRVIAFDMMGYGLSDKPDVRYRLSDQADIAEALLAELQIDSIDLVTHDMGDSVGGELLARSLDGTLPVTIEERVLTNGSIYMDLVQLSVGQELMLALPDEKLPADAAPTAELFRASLAATFAAGSQPSEEELNAQWALTERGDGHRLLPRLIRYVEERRVTEERWTGAIEAHPSRLTIIWGDHDPIAVPAMATRVAEARPDAELIMLTGIGHYPMVESPERFLASLPLRGL